MSKRAFTRQETFLDHAIAIGLSRFDHDLSDKYAWHRADHTLLLLLQGALFVVPGEQGRNYSDGLSQTTIQDALSRTPKASARSSTQHNDTAGRILSQQHRSDAAEIA